MLMAIHFIKISEIEHKTYWIPTCTQSISNIITNLYSDIVLECVILLWTSAWTYCYKNHKCFNTFERNVSFLGTDHKLFFPFLKKLYMFLPSSLYNEICLRMTHWCGIGLRKFELFQFLFHQINNFSKHDIAKTLWKLLPHIKVLISYIF